MDRLKSNRAILVPQCRAERGERICARAVAQAEGGNPANLRVRFLGQDEGEVVNRRRAFARASPMLRTSVPPMSLLWAPNRECG